MRDSPGFKILNELKSRRFNVAAYDPYYKEELHDMYLKENNLKDFNFIRLKDLKSSTIKDYHCICIIQNHKNTRSRLNEIYKNSEVPFIYDCQNQTAKNPDSKTLLKLFGN